MRKLPKLLLGLICILTFAYCRQSQNPENKPHAGQKLIHPEGNTIVSRFSPPEGFTRIPADSQSFGWYLRHLPLKADGTPVRLYNGALKKAKVYEAVVDMDIGDKDLQQCADAVMRLRGEYLYQQGRYNDISFHFNNGFELRYTDWLKGYRVKFKENKPYLTLAAEPSTVYESFRQYMDMVFSYAGTLALTKDLKPRKLRDMQIGDVFIKGGSPGHAETVMDIVVDRHGHKLFMLSQSYMPAQDIQILKNESDGSISPWYRLEPDNDTVYTPEWDFSSRELKGW